MKEEHLSLNIYENAGYGAPVLLHIFDIFGELSVWT